MKRVLVIVVAVIVVGCRGRKEQYMAAASLSQGFALAGTAKTFVGAAYSDSGKWPSSNEEARLPAPNTYASDLVNDLTVSGGGVITVHFKAGGTLKLIPDGGTADTGLRWRCATTKFQGLAALVPQCKSED